MRVGGLLDLATGKDAGAATSRMGTLIRYAAQGSGERAPALTYGYCRARYLPLASMP